MGPLCVATEIFLIQVIYLVKNRKCTIYYWGLFYLTGALYSLKLYINILQLISNCTRVIEQDEEERSKIKAEK